jgi:hypothetical protein
MERLTPADRERLTRYRASDSPAPRRRTDVHVHLPPGWGRTHDQAASTGGLPLARKDQSTEGTEQTGFEDCGVRAGDVFRVQHTGRDQMTLTRATTQDEVSELEQVAGMRPPGAAGDQRLRRVGRDRLVTLGTNGTSDSDHIAGLIELQHVLDQHYRQR